MNVHLKCYAESAVKRKRILYRAGEVRAVYFEEWEIELKSKQVALQVEKTAYASLVCFV